MINNCFDKKTVLRAIATRKAELSVNENPADETHKTVIKKNQKKKSLLDLEIIFGHQIKLKWNHCLLRLKMLDIFYVP